MRPIVLSLRARLLLIVLVAVVPALCAVLAAGLDDRSSVTLRAQAEALRTAKLVSSQLARTVAYTQSTLVGFAAVPAVRYHVGPTCSSFAASLRRINPTYANLGAVDAEGNLFCSAYPLDNTISVADRPYFQEALATRSFAGGEYLISRSTGRPALDYAYPVLGDDESVVAVVIAALDLQWLNDSLDQVDMPQDATVTVVERGGRVLVDYPHGVTSQEAAFSPEAVWRITGDRSEGSGESIGLGGEQQLIGFARANGLGSGGGVYVIVGFPAAPALAEANARTTGTVAIIFLSALFAASLGWFGSDAFLLRRIRNLLAAARRLKAGDFTARSSARASGDEIGTLSSAFDDLAVALQEREASVQRATAALSESERKYRLLFDAASDAMSIVDCDTGQILDANRLAVSMYGYSREELLMMNNVEVSAEPEATRAATFGGQRYMPIRYHRRKDGTVFAVEVTASIVNLDNRRIQIASMRDITEKLQNERALRESEERHRRLFNELVSGFALYEIICDEAGKPVDYRFLDANPAFEKMTGLLRSDVIGRTVKEVLPGIEEYWIERFGRVATQGGADGFTAYAAPLGKIYEVNAYSPRYGYCATTFHDVTERRRAEIALERHNRDLLSLHEIAEILAFERDAARGVQASLETAGRTVGAQVGWLYVSREVAVESGVVASTIVPPDAIPNGSLLLLVARQGPDEDVAHAVKWLIVPLSASDVVEATEASLHAAYLGAVDGLSEEVLRKQFSAALLVPVLGREGTIGVLGFARTEGGAFDGTEHQFLEAVGHHIGLAVENARLANQATQVEVLQQMDRLRSEFIANISHELRTPLGLILFLATTLQRAGVELPDSTQSEFLSSIEQEARRLQRLVENLVDVSRLQSGRLNLSLRVVDLRDLLVETTERLRSRLVDRRIVLDLPQQPVWADVDVIRIEQVLRNLLMNAAQYSSAGSGIIVRARDEGGSVTVAVTDDGIGIPADQLERVFERFYRIDSEAARRAGGVGLGLAISRSFVEAHGGQIWAESTPGRGSTFIFTLPGTAPQVGADASSNRQDNAERAQRAATARP